jgi:5,10-methylenetetrahydromethanopterin reductase
VRPGSRQFRPSATDLARPGAAMTTFHVGVLPNRPVAEIADFAAEAETFGFTGIWIADSQSIFRDSYVALAGCALRTSRMTLATGVTNPVTRHPATIASAIATLDELSGGRALLGIGVGESAVRTVGLRPAKLARLEEATHALRALLEGRTATWDGAETRLAWWSGRAVPIWYASTGPRSLQLGGRVADGVLFQVGSHPDLVGYALRRIDDGADAAGRPPEQVRRLVRLACSVDVDGDRARTDARGYVAAAAGTVFGAVPREEMPGELWAELARMKEGYDYFQHAAATAPHAELITDAILDAIAVAGTPEDVVPRLRELIALGADGFVLTVTSAEPSRSLRTLAEHVLPHFDTAGGDT